MRDRLLTITSHRATLPLILVLCLGVRLAVSLTYSDKEVIQDAALFMEVARNIADGNGFSLGGPGHLHPSAYGFVIYPYFLASLMYGFGDASLLVVSLVQTVVDTLACLLVFLFALQVTRNRLAAVIASLVYCLYPPFVLDVCEATPETTSAAILIGSAFLLYRAFEGRRWGFAIAGAVMGVAILARPSLLMLPIFLGLVMFLKRREIAGWLPKAAIFTAAAYLAVSPWTLRNYKVFHAFEPVTSNMGMVLWQATGPFDGKCEVPLYPMAVAGQGHPDESRTAIVSERTYRKISKLREETQPLDEVPRDRALRRAAIQEIRENPGRVLLVMLRKPFRLWFSLFPDFPISVRSYCVAVLNALFLALALLAFRRPYADRRFKIISGALLVYGTLVSFGTSAVTRYSYTFMPFVIILAASFVCGGLRKPGAGAGPSDKETVT